MLDGGTSQRDGMDAIELLTREHRVVLATVRELLETPAAETAVRRERLRTVAHRVHALGAIKRHFFLPEAELEGLSSQTEASGRAWEMVEHLLADLAGEAPDSPRFDAKARGLALLLERHARDQEAGVFPRFAHQLGKGRLERLGIEMETALEVIEGAPSGAGEAPPRQE